jgi:hypothetical protein
MYISFAGGQDVLFIVLGLSAALWLMDSGRRGWAGFALGICLIKFHLIWAIVLVLIRQRRNRQIGGILATACCFIFPGFLVNFHWPLDYYSTIFDGQNVISKVPYTLFPWLGWMGLAGVAVGVWFGAARLPLNIAASTALAAAVVVSPHGYVADYTLLSPMVALIWESRHQTARSQGNKAG